MEERIKKLEMQVQNLQLAFDRMSRSQTTTVGRVDDTSNKVTDLTPYTETKTAYISDQLVVFDDVPYGLVSVYANGASYYNFFVSEQHSVKVYFDEPLEEVTTVSISIQ